VETPWGDLFLFAEDEQRLVVMLARLCQDAKARAAFLVDQNGGWRHPGDSAGLTPRRASRAGSIAATGGLARLIGERAFSGLFHEGERSHLYVTVVSEGLILVVSFDRSSSAGLVRFRVRRASEEIGQAFAEITVAWSADPNSRRSPMRTSRTAAELRGAPTPLRQPAGTANPAEAEPMIRPHRSEGHRSSSSLCVSDVVRLH
jgi:hypothetical protein